MRIGDQEVCWGDIPTPSSSAGECSGLTDARAADAATSSPKGKKGRIGTLVPGDCKVGVSGSADINM